MGEWDTRIENHFYKFFQLRKKGPPSAADKEEAERLKTEGNNLMRTEKFTEALDMYSKVRLTTRSEVIIFRISGH